MKEIKFNFNAFFNELRFPALIQSSSKHTFIESLHGKHDLTSNVKIAYGNFSDKLRYQNVIAFHLIFLPVRPRALLR